MLLTSPDLLWQRHVARRLFTVSFNHPRVLFGPQFPARRILHPRFRACSWRRQFRAQGQPASREFWTPIRPPMGYHEEVSLVPTLGLKETRGQEMGDNDCGDFFNPDIDPKICFDIFLSPARPNNNSIFQSEPSLPLSLPSALALEVDQLVLCSSELRPGCIVRPGDFADFQAQGRAGVTSISSLWRLKYPSLPS